MSPTMAPLQSLVSEFGPDVASRWFGAADHLERGMLRRLAGPVLEIGCGPGRLVEALIDEGTMALGIDVAPAAVHAAFRRGVPVLNQCVFERIPGEGDWASVVLLDGSIGIGGDPCRLLRRVRAVLRGDGVALVEVGPPGSGFVRRVLHDGAAWARVDTDHVGALAAAAGFASMSLETHGGRCYAWLAGS